jgi:putative sigma-54 modulation protein
MMDVIVRGHNIKISDTIQEFAQDKIGKLDRYLPNITNIYLDLSRQPTKRGEGITIAQITLHHSRGAILRTEEKVNSNDRDSMMIAVINAVDKMYRQIERFKGKRNRGKQRQHKQYRFIATEEELVEAENVPNYEEIAKEYEYDDEIVRRKEITVTAMNEEEAIEQMELLTHAFFMFQNSETGAINVLYRRDGGGYGILVPAGNAVG